MFRSQCGYISERQTGEARKQKDVLDKLQPRNIKFPVHYSLKLVVCQEYRISLVLFHLISVKRVFPHPFFGYCHIGDFLQAFHVADYCVAAQSGFCLQENIKSLDEIRGKFMERNIILLIKTRHKRFKFSEHILITVDGDGRIVYVNNLFHRGNFFFDCSKQRPDSLILSEHTL